jgi:hypothetical protein
MAQTTTPARPRPIPAWFGRAYRQVAETARALTDEQYAKLYRALSDALSAGHYSVAVLRTQTALFDIGVDPDDLIAEQPVTVVDAAMAVLARDRGVITDADFDTITSVWTAAGLPLPAAITIDDDADGPIDDMTTDRIADELMISGVADPKVYGAVLMLTGYNHGELLAYPAVRQFLQRDDDGKLRVRWVGLARAAGSGAAEALPQVGGDARRALSFAAALRQPMLGKELRLPVSLPGGADFDDNAEVMAIAFAHAMGAGHLIGAPAGDDLVITPVAVPAPRSASEPGEP